MGKFLKIIITLCTIMPFCVSAGGNGSGEDEVKKSSSLLTKERAKEIIQILREGNFSHSGGAEAINILNRKLISLVPGIKEVNSLEVGCGTGAASNFMQKEGYNNLWAIDINEKAIEEAKIQYPSVNFQVADVTKLTKIFEDDFFEFIYSFNVTHAMQDKVPMLQRLKEISKRGTTLAIFDYYLKDESSAEAIKNLSGKDIFPIKLSKFKMIMKILGWKIIEEIEVTDKYKFWHKAMLEKIEARIGMLKGKNYTDDEIKLVIERFQHLLDAIESERLGGMILIAKKI